MSEAQFQPFPKWKFHPDIEPVMVQNAQEEEALGQDWFDRPGLAQEAKERAVAALKKLELKAK